MKEVQIIKREEGFCKVEEGMSVPLLATWWLAKVRGEVSLGLSWPAKEEREKGGTNGGGWWKCVEVSGSCKGLEFWKIGKGFGLWRKERNKGKGKRKRNSYEEIFSWKRI